MWVTRELARQHWADAVSLDDSTLDDLLSAAYASCYVYAPKLTDRSVSDGVTTSGSKLLTSATAAFKEREVGRTVSGTGIPVVTTIEGWIDATTVVLSAAATATATGVRVNVSGVPDSYMLANILQAREVRAATMRGEQDVIGIGDYAIRARPLTAAVKQLLRPQRARWVVG